MTHDIRQPWKDALEAWFNVIRRLQSVACRQQGYAIITISVVVDQNGNPVFWEEPQLKKLEPRGKAGNIIANLISGARP